MNTRSTPQPFQRRSPRQLQQCCCDAVVVITDITNLSWLAQICKSQIARTGDTVQSYCKRSPERLQRLSRRLWSVLMTTGCSDTVYLWCSNIFKATIVATSPRSRTSVGFCTDKAMQCDNQRRGIETWLLSSTETLYDSRPPSCEQRARPSVCNHLPVHRRATPSTSR